MMGEKTRLCGRRPEDLLRETLWGADAELQALDPPVGVIINNYPLSIMTLEGKHIGTCSLYNIGKYDAQLGIRIGDKNYMDKGYGTDAVRALIDYGFTVIGIKHIWLKVLPTNVRAIRCYEKCGFSWWSRLVYDGREFVMMGIKEGEHQGGEK